MSEDDEKTAIRRALTPQEQDVGLLRRHTDGMSCHVSGNDVKRRHHVGEYCTWHIAAILWAPLLWELGPCPLPRRWLWTLRVERRTAAPIRRGSWACCFSACMVSTIDDRTTSKAANGDTYHHCYKANQENMIGNYRGWRRATGNANRGLALDRLNIDPMLSRKLYTHTGDQNGPQGGIDGRY